MQRLLECCETTMVFDVLSFLAGVAAGGLTGLLAGILHGLERTADVQERLRLARRNLDQISSRLSESGGGTSGDTAAKVDELQRDLDEIHEEIKRMYKRTAR